MAFFFEKSEKRLVGSQGKALSSNLFAGLAAGCSLKVESSSASKKPSKKFLKGLTESFISPFLRSSHRGVVFLDLKPPEIRFLENKINCDAWAK